MKEYGFNTTLLHGTEGNNPHGATQVPIYQSSAFRHDTAEELEKIFSNKMAGYSYTRINNPTIESFEKRMAKLEGGIGSVACSSGMAAWKKKRHMCCWENLRTAWAESARLWKRLFR